MKVFFDDDGRLTHFGCGGQVLADVEIEYRGLLITNDDDDWNLGEFEAHVCVEADKWDAGYLRNVRCARCNASGMTVTAHSTLVLITEDELDDKQTNVSQGDG